MNISGPASAGAIAIAEAGTLEGVGLLSSEGRVLRLSESARVALDVDILRAVGRPFTELLDRGDVDAFAELWERDVVAGRAVECTVRARGPGPDSTRLHLRLEPPASGDAPTIMVVRSAGSGWGGPRQEARLLRRVTEAANEAATTPDLFDRVVADIVDTMGWAEGRIVATPDGDGSTVVAGPARSELPGSTLSDDAGGPGTGVVTLPVIADGEVAAVLEFTTHGVVFLDDSLDALLTNVGRQLGSVVEREEARAALHKRTQELERSNEELERFAYVASHDLQEPLRKIVGFAELLEQQYQDRFDGDGRDYLGYVVDGARRMQGLIKDLLAYSRAGRATPAPKRVNLTSLVDRVLDVLEWSIEEAGAEVLVGELPTVWGDAGQLSEVVTNIIANAVKYGPDGGATITIGADPAVGGTCEITIADNGIGIDPQYAEQVFEVFRRLHGPTEYPGTGIGLAITRRFVQANGGRIWVVPNEPEGSVFHFTVAMPAEEMP